jgi:hypothetical protein
MVTYLQQKCVSCIFITNDIFALMFANNISSIVQTVSKLQTQINAINAFCEGTGVKLNLDKSKITVFQKSG